MTHDRLIWVIIVIHQLIIELLNYTYFVLLLVLNHILAHNLLIIL